MPDFTPSQTKALFASPGKPSIYASTGGAVLTEFALTNLSLLPSIPAGSTIHDNACGPGSVSKLLLTSPNTPSGLKTHATDIDPVFLTDFQSSIDTHNWPVTITNVKSETLPFDNNVFDFSFTNMGIHFTSSAGLDGAREIHRTLKPGGIAVVNCWKDITWLPAFLEVAKATRPSVTFPRPPVFWNDGSHLKKIMVEAGFREEELRVEQSEAWAKTGDLRDWAEKAWAFLGGQGGWHEGDEGRWEEAVELLAKLLLEHSGTKRVGEEVWMKASQWVVVAKK